MITIITGVPGMGKTAMLVHELLKNDKSTSNARPVFVMGINSLLIDHVQAPPISEWTEKRVSPEDDTLMLDYFTFPPNSILVVDEAQRVFRTRASGSKPPPHVMALETHRHTGLDIILLTQKPHLIDSNVRELCGRHVHIKNTILGRKLFEWFEFNDVNNKGNLDAAIKRSYSPPKEVFSLYKSAEVHTKQPRRLHQIWLYLGLATIACFYFGYKIFTKISEKIAPLSAPTELIQASTIPDPKLTLDTITKKQPEPLQNAVHQSEPLETTHPYKNHEFMIEGYIKSKTRTVTYYHIVSDNSSIKANSDDLKKLGYSINQVSECSSFIFFEGAQIVATCKGNDSTQGGGYAAMRAAMPSFNPPKPEPEIQPEPIRITPNTVGMKSNVSPNNS